MCGAYILQLGGSPCLLLFSSDRIAESTKTLRFFYKNQYLVEALLNFSVLLFLDYVVRGVALTGLTRKVDRFHLY